MCSALKNMMTEEDARSFLVEECKTSLSLSVAQPSSLSSCLHHIHWTTSNDDNAYDGRESIDEKALVLQLDRWDALDIVTIIKNQLLGLWWTHIIIPSLKFYIKQGKGDKRDTVNGILHA